MKIQKILSAGLMVLAVVTLSAPPATAGGNLETPDITGLTITFPPFFDGTMIPIRWDARCIPVRFTYFDDGINEPPGAAAALMSGMQSWNDIPTSFIELQLAGTVAAPGNPGGAFDFVNEINFDASGGFLAAAPSTSLIVDTTLAPGDNLDGDGDSDVFDPAVEGIDTCADVDNDGDVDFPAGFYKAGTILDSDVFFNGGVPWSVGTSAVDIEAVAVHEFGHNHGLSHSMINQRSTNGDQPGVSLAGDGATMFPFIDTGDPDAEIDQRSPAADDMAWSSFNYPEGSAASGPAALQAGDVDFDDVYGTITGEVTSGAQGGLPLAGASVQARDKSTGQVVTEGYSGTTRLGVFVFSGFPSDVGAGFFLTAGGQPYHIVNGNYTIPVPKGNYDVFVEALDGRPAAAGNISITAILGNIFGQLDFEEEFYNVQESASETRPGLANPVNVLAGENEPGVDFVTNVISKLSNHDGSINFIGFTGAPGGRQYAVRFANADVTALLAGDAVLHTGLIETDVVDASVVPVFTRATLAGGSVDGGTGNLVITKTLRESAPFIGQDSDSSPFFFDDPGELSDEIRDDLAAGDYEDLFLIVEVPAAPFPGDSGIPPLVGLDSNPPFVNSYISDDGGVTFVPVTTRNLIFDLVATP